jgi:carbamoyl-phosphate synthase large subunit
MPTERKKPTHILITGVGHPIAEATIRSLRQITDAEFYIVGVDVEERGGDFDWVDKHYVVPSATSQEYVSTVLDICRKEDVHVLIPWSDQEVEAVSRAASAFHGLGTATLCGSYESVQRSVDKGKMLQELARTDISIPWFELASSPEQIEKAAKKVGYPENKVVVKPRRESCGRGLWIVDSEIDLIRQHGGPGQRLTLSTLLFILREAERVGKETPDYVVMEFLPGQDYSVDVLADSGEPIFVIPRRRVKTVEGISQVCEIAPNPAVRSMATRIIRELGLHLNVNIQMKYNKVHGGEPLVYEVNPRISGTIFANDGAGINLLYYGIQLVLGNRLPSPESVRVQETRMVRNWVGRYTHADRWFNP